MVDVGTPPLGAQPYCDRSVVSGKLRCRDEGSRCVMSASVIVESHEWPGRPQWSPRASLLALARGPALFALAMAGLALLVVPLLVPSLVVLGLVAVVALPPHGVVIALLLWTSDVLVVRYGLPMTLLWARRLAKLTRRVSTEWLGVPIPEPYLPAPDYDIERLSFTRFRLMASDPATGRDLLWIVTNGLFGWILAMAPVLLASAGLIGCIGYGIAGMPHASPVVRASARATGGRSDDIGAVVSAASAAGIRRLGPRHARSSSRSCIGATSPTPGPDSCRDDRRQRSRDSAHRAGSA